MGTHLRSLAAVLAITAGPAHARSPRLAVVTLDAPPALRFTGKSVAEAFAKQAERGRLDVLGPAAVEVRLGPAAHAELVRCGDDARCLARNGAKLGVDRIVGGRLDRKTASYRVVLVHADAKTGDRLGGIEREIPIASRRLQQDVASAAPGLLAGEEAIGWLRVVTDVPGAEVTLDDERVGTTPLVRIVNPGKHRVRVSRDGWSAAEPRWVDVRANETTVHRPRLYPIPARERPNPSPTEGHGTDVEVLK